MTATNSGTTTDFQMSDLPNVMGKMRELKKRMDEADERFVVALMQAGFTLIPHDMLGPNQIMVGRELYDAVKRAAAKPIQPDGDPVKGGE